MCGNYFAPKHGIFNFKIIYSFIFRNDTLCTGLVMEVGVTCKVETIACMILGYLTVFVTMFSYWSVFYDTILFYTCYTKMKGRTLIEVSL